MRYSVERLFLSVVICNMGVRQGSCGKLMCCKHALRTVNQQTAIITDLTEGIPESITAQSSGDRKRRKNGKPVKTKLDFGILLVL